jgi:hypothetical protein
LENAIRPSQVQEQIRTAIAQGAGRGIPAAMSNGIAHIATHPASPPP